MALLAPLALLLLAAPSSAAVLPNTDWRDSLIADFPLRELGDGPRQAANLTACVALCRADRECVAVAWNPAMGQAQCQLKCAARPDDRFTSPNTTGVIVRPNNATSCPRPSFVPPAWQADIAAGTLLLAGPSEPAGHVGNGYVAAYIQSPPGSSGPTVQGVEHIAGVYAGRRLDNPPHTWPSAECDTWCDRAHRADLASFTSTAKVGRIDGRPAIGTASGQHLGQSAYLLVSTTDAKHGGAKALTCVQRTYAHRSRIHLLLTEFECINAGAAPHTVELTEPGPSSMPLRAGGFAKAAPMGELDHRAIESGIAGVSCSRVQVKVPEAENGTRAIVGECHTDCDGRAFTVPPSGRSFVSCVSARHSSIDKDATGADPVALAKQSWRLANASASTLWESHVEAQRELFVPGIEVEGNVEIARVINVTVEALLAGECSNGRLGLADSEAERCCGQRTTPMRTPAWARGAWLRMPTLVPRIGTKRSGSSPRSTCEDSP